LAVDDLELFGRLLVVFSSAREEAARLATRRPAETREIRGHPACRRRREEGRRLDT